jgi:hypothetical protein
MPERKRSPLSKPDLRRHYVERGELAALEQLRADARRIDEDGIAVGPFARLDAAAVAAADGKTRGAISNVFGNQAAFQAATMALALSADQWIEDAADPDPDAYATAEDWVTAFFARQSARGPRHGADPAAVYGSLWALWLSVVPYGLWSDAIRRPSLEEYAHWLAQIEAIFGRAIGRFGQSLRPGVTVAALAHSAATLIEGVWLNQCLTSQNPADPRETISDAMCKSGLMLWRGAVTDPRPANGR